MNNVKLAKVDIKNNSENIRPNKLQLLTDRKDCNKQEILNSIKLCTILLKRDDGGYGTGIVLKDNYVVTNKHVVEGAKTIKTSLDYKIYDLEVLGTSENVDLAALKVINSKELYNCPWFDSKILGTAEELYAFGWPISDEIEVSVSRGILSRVIKDDGIVSYLQTDTALNPGNSGGPLVNECGIVGVNTMKISIDESGVPIEGASFAISSRTVSSLIEELIYNNGAK